MRELTPRLGLIKLLLSITAPDTAAFYGGGGEGGGQQQQQGGRGRLGKRRGMSAAMAQLKRPRY